MMGILFGGGSLTSDKGELFGQISQNDHSPQVGISLQNVVKS